MIDFADKLAVVTGAASGIGLACAQALAAEGARVVLTDVRSDVVEMAAAAIVAQGGRAYALAMDVSVAASVTDTAAEISARWGDPHILVNSAGVLVRGVGAADADDELWRWLMGVNLYGVIHTTKAFLPAMLASGEECQVINIASISGLVAAPRRIALYSTSKFAVVGYSEALRVELQESRVDVSVVIPAAVSTDFYLTSALHRGEMGGANSFAETPVDTAAGMSPAEVAERTLDGVRHGRFLIATHADLRPLLEARHAEIEEACEAAERFRPAGVAGADAR